MKLSLFDLFCFEVMNAVLKERARLRCGVLLSHQVA